MSVSTDREVMQMLPRRVKTDTGKTVKRTPDCDPDELKRATREDLAKFPHIRECEYCQTVLWEMMQEILPSDWVREAIDGECQCGAG